MISPPMLTDNALTVLKSRYLRGSETPEMRFAAIADVIGGRLRSEAYELMATGTWLPNTPTIANAGRTNQLAACFVLPIDDALANEGGTGIFDIVRTTALIHQSGGGTGYSFGRLRPEGHPVRSSNGVASGPVSFMNVFNASTGAISQGGIRRGAMMAELPIDHPDVVKFIYCKSTDQKALTNFNISVAITEKFMAAMEAGAPWDLLWEGKVVQTVDAKLLWDALVTSAWRYGDPGLFFVDRANAFNPLAQDGELFEATNPCGEVPLLPWEPCNLGSINLGRFIKGLDFDMMAFNQVAQVATELLDNVVSANEIPIPQVRAANLRTRRIGLGVMGWASMLNRMRIAYDSNEALALAWHIGGALRIHAQARSEQLAERSGAYPAWHPGHGPKRRNVAVLSIAPTGSISTIADRQDLDCSPGIEPYYDYEVVRKLAIGNIKEKYPDADQSWFRIAGKISGEYHVETALAWQRSIDNAVSKTVNLPFSATIADVDAIYRRAWKGGAKGITIYRNNSRDEQVYNSIPPIACGPECELPAVAN